MAGVVQANTLGSAEFPKGFLLSENKYCCILPIPHINPYQMTEPQVTAQNLTFGHAIYPCKPDIFEQTYEPVE